MGNKDDRLSGVFAALADSTRRRILERLAARGESGVTALARPHRMSLPAISKHLRVLEASRLVRRRRNGRVHLIRARADGLRIARAWIARTARFWDEAFDALDAMLQNQEKGE